MKKKVTKKRKLSNPVGSNDNSFLDGSTTLHGFTAMGKTHLGGNILDAKARIV